MPQPKKAQPSANKAISDPKIKMKLQTTGNLISAKLQKQLESLKNKVICSNCGSLLTFGNFQRIRELKEAELAKKSGQGIFIFGSKADYWYLMVDNTIIHVKWDLCLNCNQLFKIAFKELDSDENK